MPDRLTSTLPIHAHCYFVYCPTDWLPVENKAGIIMQYYKWISNELKCDSIVYCVNGQWIVYCVNGQWMIFTCESHTIILLGNTKASTQEYYQHNDLSDKYNSVAGHSHCYSIT